MKEKLVVGWREWVRLPELGVRLIKVKVDTGARTSALHVDDLHMVHRRTGTWAYFTVHPKQRTNRGAVQCHARVIEERAIRSSSGHTQIRPVIVTDVDIGGTVWPIELTLTSRDVMGFRMLLGRQAVRRKALVDPGRSFLTRKVKVVKKKRAR